MAITDAQKVELFDILEVPLDYEVYEPVDKFRMSAITNAPSSAEQKLQAKIESRLAAIDGTAKETKLVSLIAEWQQVGVNVASIDGSIGGVNGVTYDPREQQMRIQRSVKIIIPVMQYVKEIQLGRETEKGGMNMETFR